MALQAQLRSKAQEPITTGRAMRTRQSLRMLYFKD